MRVGVAPRSLPRLVDAAVVLCVLAGVGLRAWILASAEGSLDSDEAVWGLMAKHALDGELSVFFWGQSYGGTQEALLTAPLVWLFGTSRVVLKLVPIVLFALAALLVWRVGRRTVGEPTARLAAGLFWAWPTYTVWKSTKAHGFYGAGLVLGLAVVLLALRLAERPSRRDLALLGLAAGLGWWATPQVAILALPAVAWLVWKRPSILRGAWIAIPAALVAALPWLIWNVRHDWGSFSFPADEARGLPQVKRLFASALPTALGLRVPFSLEWLPGPLLGWALYGAALAAFAYLLVRGPGVLAPLLLACLVFPVFYAAAPFAGRTDEPRYLVLLGPVLALLLVAGLSRLPVLAAGTCACLALSIAGLALVEKGRLGLPFAEDVRTPSDLGPLLDTLERDGIRHAFANYWVAYRITFESDERIVAAPSRQDAYLAEKGRVVPLDEGEGRYPRYYREAAASLDTAHVFVADGAAEGRSRAILERAGYRRARAGGLVVYLPPDRGRH